MAWRRPSLFHVARVCGAGLLIAAAVVAAGYVLVQLATLTLALFVALLLTCLLWPLARRLERWHLPKTLASALAVLLAVGVVAGALAWVLPTAAQELSENREQLTANAQASWSALRERLPDGLRQQVEKLPGMLPQHSQRLLTGLSAGLVTAAELLGGLLLALVLSVFFLRDGQRLAQGTLERLSEPKRRVFEPALGSAWKTLRGWIRGAAVIALVDAVGIGVGLALLGVPLALPLAVLTFFAAFIPVLGATVAGALAVLVAWATGGTTDALIALAIVVGVQQLEGNVLEPLVMGRSVPLHPATVLVVVTAGAVLFGIAGAFASVPLAAMATAFFGEVQRRSLPPAHGGRGPAASPREAAEEGLLLPAEAVDERPAPH